jgi:hypothetical protein
MDLARPPNVDQRRERGGIVIGADSVHDRQRFGGGRRRALMIASTRAWHRLAIASCILGALSRPAGAQSRASFGAVHEYVAFGAESAAQVTLPSNLIASPIYREVLESMIHGSATFRRQCLRIAGEPLLTIRLEPAPASWTRGARAITRIVRQPRGLLSATIDIGRFENEVELIAHELEHIIEQLDEVDLPSRAVLPDTGVHALDAGGMAFETARAVRVGLTVARDVRAIARRAD